MSYFSPEEYELWMLIRKLGGTKKIKEFLESLEKHNVKIDTLQKYLESLDYKVPSPLEARISDLERRLLELEKWKTSISAPVEEEKKVRLTEHLEKGEITHQKDYTMPILETLIEMGGRGRSKDVINRVLEKMKNKLKPKDLEMLPSGKEIRCVNHARWERWRLVNEGYIRKDTPPGIWEITEKGREYYEKLKIKS